MGLQENMAVAIRTVMLQRRKSLTEFSEELEISRTALYDFLKAKGNPSAATIEHLADKMGVSPAALMTGLLELDQREIVLQLLDTIHGVAELPEEKRIYFAELFLEMVKLWSGDTPPPASGSPRDTALGKNEPRKRE